jgi:hypothetical protein
MDLLKQGRTFETEEEGTAAFTFTSFIQAYIVFGGQVNMLTATG